MFCDVKGDREFTVNIVKWPLWCLQIGMIEVRTYVKIYM